MKAGRAALCVGLMLCGLAVEASAEGLASNPAAGTEWAVTFALDEPPGKNAGADTWHATLTVYLRGKPEHGDDIVAIVEGTLFTRMLVPMAPGPAPGSRQVSLSIAVPATKTKDQSAVTGDIARSFHRVDVSFARLRGMGFTPFLKRSAYLTVGPRPARIVETLPKQPPPRPAPESPVLSAPLDLPDPPPPGIERPPVPPVLYGAVSEADISPPPLKLGFQDYWQELRTRITARFGQKIIAQASFARKPRVRFRLYWDGVAQVIFLERSSGNARVDQAALESVVDAHPLPAFPPAMTDSYADVHVDFSVAPKPAASKRRGRR